MQKLLISLIKSEILIIVPGFLKSSDELSTHENLQKSASLSLERTFILLTNGDFSCPNRIFITFLISSIGHFFCLSNSKIWNFELSRR